MDPSIDTSPIAPYLADFLNIPCSVPHLPFPLRAQFMDPSIDTSPIAPYLAEFFDNVLDASVSELNFKAIVDGLGEVLFK